MLDWRRKNLTGGISRGLQAANPDYISSPPSVSIFRAVHIKDIVDDRTHLCAACVAHGLGGLMVH